MMLKFQKFLYKIFQNQVHVELDIQDDFSISVRDFVLSKFMIAKSESDCISAEAAISRMLTKKEKSYILKILKEILPFEPEIDCYLCETCFGYYPDTPYHVELIDKDILKKEELLSIEYKYYGKEILKSEDKRKKSYLIR